MKHEGAVVVARAHLVEEGGVHPRRPRGSPSALSTSTTRSSPPRRTSSSRSAPVHQQLPTRSEAHRLHALLHGGHVRESCGSTLPQVSEVIGRHMLPFWASVPAPSDKVRTMTSKCTCRIIAVGAAVIAQGRCLTACPMRKFGNTCQAVPLAWVWSASTSARPRRGRPSSRRAESSQFSSPDRPGVPSAGVHKPQPPRRPWSGWSWSSCAPSYRPAFRRSIWRGRHLCRAQTRGRFSVHPVVADDRMLAWTLP